MKNRTLLCALAAVATPLLAEDHQVAVSSFTFTPSELTIQVGDTVTWTNQGGTHNVEADDGSFRCANGCDGAGGDGNPASNAWSFTLTFDEPAALIRYFCQIHGGTGGVGMSGSLTVEPAGPIDEVFEDRFEQP